ncbi:hypothetical protein [Desulfovibrio ferrophilus]|uniref:Uncharacterized protein n=1 Tax=Desulfovibrio ferrophilus TaxID=241368 RepID=A0A2Z6AVJ7_9BACT|nr:hypothetical protein [Desulfovibrio ferrophilus]BBD07240.1 uncharacterized protein DFE_0514 [Desulfovibrio ferrophilus]
MPETIRTPLSRLANSKAARYFRASPLPHATASASLAIAVALAMWALDLQPTDSPWTTILGIKAIGWLGLAGIALMDGFSRYREYRRIKHMLSSRGWNRRIFLLVAGSRCQRDAAMQAAHETGLGQRAQNLFRTMGYRWYHLLPDAVLRNPLMFFHPRFLRNSFLPGKSLTQARRNVST